MCYQPLLFIPFTSILIIIFTKNQFRIDKNSIKEVSLFVIYSLVFIVLATAFVRSDLYINWAQIGPNSIRSGFTLMGDLTFETYRKELWRMVEQTLPAPIFFIFLTGIILSICTFKKYKLSASLASMGLCFVFVLNPLFIFNKAFNMRVDNMLLSFFVVFTIILIQVFTEKTSKRKADKSYYFVFLFLLFATILLCINYPSYKFYLLVLSCFYLVPQLRKVRFNSFLVVASLSLLIHEAWIYTSRMKKAHKMEELMYQEAYRAIVAKKVLTPGRINVYLGRKNSRVFYRSVDDYSMVGYFKAHNIIGGVRYKRNDSICKGRDFISQVDNSSIAICFGSYYKYHYPKENIAIK